MKPITQSRFIRGLNATFGLFSQPDGTVPRLSNLVLTKRGSLTTCFGSQLLAQGTVSNSGLQGNDPMWLELFLYQVLGSSLQQGARQIFGLMHMPQLVSGNVNHVFLVSLPTANEAFPLFNPGVAPNYIFDFGPFFGITAIDSALGGVGGGGGGLNQGLFHTALQYPVVPQILQFTNKMVLCLGSIGTPYISDGTAAGTVPISTNTFSAQYPLWQPNVSWPQGSLIQAFIGSAYYIFRATQGGTSAATAPSWPATLGTTIVDSTVIWQNQGQLSTSPVPRGAAHGISYAGSLWLANTYPEPTSDGLDGPSAIRMSDINNYNSWNPFNAANLGLGDGTEITGFASFTIAELGISPTGSLIVFKQFSTYQIIGIFGSANLTIQPLQTDLGNIAPRSIQFLPSYGIMRLSHLGFALTDGVRDKLTSEEIRPYLFGGTLDDVDIIPIDWNFAYFSKAAQTAHPPMYVCACPVIGGIPLQLFSGVTATLVSASSSFTGQTWYSKVSVLGPTNYEYAITPEFGPFVLDSSHGLQVVIPATVTGSVTVHLYIYQKSSNGQPISGFYVSLGSEVAQTVLIQNLTSFSPGNPPSGKVGALTRLFCFDLILRAWAVVDLPWPISVLKQFRMHGSVPITVSGGYSDQTVRRILSEDTDWDGEPIAWSVRSREVFGEGGSQELFMRRLIIRGFGQETAQHMYIYPTYDGEDDPGHTVGETVQVTALGNDQFEVRLDLQRIARNVHVLLLGQGQVEIESMEYEVEPCEVGAPIVIA